jgi:phage terminase large subunit-like protein
VVAVDERQAGIVFGIARRMVELDEELSSRCQVFKERLLIPDRDAQMHCPPAEPKRLEGLDYTLAILSRSASSAATPTK